MTLVAAAALLTACGGGDTALTPSESFASRIAKETPAAVSLPETSPRASRASVPAISNNQLFQWAQLQFPELFGSAAPNVFANLQYNGQVFDVREFPGGNYLGVSQGRAYGLGPLFTNGELVDFGDVQSYAAQVCGRLNCGGTGGNTGGGTGTLNGCMLPASEALRTGNRFIATYQYDLFSPQASSGEFTVNTLVEGGTTFEGQSAIRLTTRTAGVQQGQALDITSVSFEQVAEGGLTRILGSEAMVPFLGGSNVTSRIVNTPPELNNEFTLQPGQSLDKTTTSTSTYVNAPFPLPPITDTATERFTYEARESIDVLGRRYDTCRYTITTPGEEQIAVNWYIFGKGVSARIEARNTAGAVLSRAELKSASINGSPL